MLSTKGNEKKKEKKKKCTLLRVFLYFDNKRIKYVSIQENFIKIKFVKNSKV